MHQLSSEIAREIIMAPHLSNDDVVAMLATLLEIDGLTVGPKPPAGFRPIGS